MNWKKFWCWHRWEFVNSIPKFIRVNVRGGYYNTVVTYQCKKCGKIWAREETWSSKPVRE